MKRASSSDIAKAKQRRAQRRSNARGKPAAADGGAPPAAAPPAEPFDQLLPRFARAIDDYHRRTPHLAAYDHLQAHDPQVAQLLNLQAAEVLSQLSRGDQQDAVARHHLAIIHHGTAIQIHHGDNAAAEKALPHWREGLNCWADLLQQDGFWSFLEQRWREYFRGAPNDMLVERLLTTDLSRVRQQLPDYLLKVHVEIVEASFRSNPRIAQEHMQLIKTSRFGQPHIDRARQRAYKSLVGDVAHLCQDLQFDQAGQRITKYLEIDPDYTKAQMDRLYLCARHCEHLAADESTIDLRVRLLSSSESIAKSPAVQQAAGQTVVAETLRKFYHHWALALLQKARKLPEAAVAEKVRYHRQASSHSGRAAQFENKTGGQTSRQLHSVICTDGAMIDLQRIEGNYQDAKQMLDLALQADRQDAFAHAVLARYYFERDDRRNFEQQLAKAAQVNRSANNQNAKALIDVLQQARASGSGSRQFDRILSQGAGQLNASQFSQALMTLRQAEPLAGQVNGQAQCQLYFCMSVCYLRTGDAAQTVIYLQQALALLGPGVDRQLQEQVRGAARAIGMQT